MRREVFLRGLLLAALSVMPVDWQPPAVHELERRRPSGAWSGRHLGALADRIAVSLRSVPAFDAYGVQYCKRPRARLRVSSSTKPDVCLKSSAASDEVKGVRASEALELGKLAILEREW